LRKLPQTRDSNGEIRKRRKSMIKKYGKYWERSKMFSVDNGRVCWTEDAWPEDGADIDGAKGVYILYRGERPVYVGLGIKGKSNIAARLQEHTRDWLAPWWDSVCWYEFKDETAARMAESLLISHLPGIWNGDQRRL